MAYKIKGKVKSLKLQLEARPHLKGKAVYCSFQVESSKGETATFYLLRSIQSQAVDLYQKKYELAVTWSQVSQAIIAILKDAILHKRDVTCVGPNKNWNGQTGPPMAGQLYNTVKTIELH